MEGIHDNEEHTGSAMGQGLQTMFLFNAFKKGEMNIELVLLVLLPMIYQSIDWNNVQTYLHWKEWKRWLEDARRKTMHHRYITYRYTRTYWGGNYSVDEDTENSVLLKAIELYLHNHVKLELKSANVDLTFTGADANSFWGYDSDDDDDDGNRKESYLRKHQLVSKPMENEWQKLGSFGTPPAPVELFCSHTEDTAASSDSSSSNTKNSTCTKSFHLVSKNKNSIEDFLQSAYKNYLQQLREQEKTESRYYYEITSLNGARSLKDDDEGNNHNVFRRYELSEEKTFESLFFQEKNDMLKLVENFEKKAGKYAIKGYPHKLGILLHGPPGTGKTSLIKALAQRTSRSIVNVPLAKITTNSELTSIFFDNKYHLHDDEGPVRMGFKDVIFVMEDVDAASNVVHKRAAHDLYSEGEEEAHHILKPEDLIELPAPKSLWRMLLESSGTNEKCNQLVKLLMEKSDRLKKEASKPEVLQSVTKRMMVLPGLGLVGEIGSAVRGDDDDEEGSDDNNNNIVNKIGEKAVKAATNLMEKYNTVDEFFGTHAETIKSIMETAGTEINDSFVEYMLQPARPSMMGLAGLPEASSVHELPGSPNRQTEQEPTMIDDALALLNSKLTELSSSSPTNSFYIGGESGSTDNASHKEQRDAAAGAVFEGPSGFGKAGGIGGGSSSMWGASKMRKDALNLTGILNVLDGVVDTPGRILIMTTNHPEILDPALIRPGRIDKTILLGYMHANDVVSMLEHYYPEEPSPLKAEYRERIENVIAGNVAKRVPPLKLTPAQVEQLTAEYIDVEDMLQALEAKAQPVNASRIKLRK